MCLAVPMLLVEKKGLEGTVELGGVRRTISLALQDDAQVGDHVLVHAGYAIAKVDADEARETLELLSQLGEPAGLP
jgi:hydrogenase expression/formation protein HypC